MTQPTPEPVDPFADEQETLRLQQHTDQPDPDATRPMSLAELRELGND
ncbi:hypothetical protein ACQP2P_03940 [Dactylosporangium sp. CA-139114]